MQGHLKCQRKSQKISRSSHSFTRNLMPNLKDYPPVWMGLQIKLERKFLARKPKNRPAGDCGFADENSSRLSRLVDRPVTLSLISGFGESASRTGSVGGIQIVRSRLVLERSAHRESPRKSLRGRNSTGRKADSVRCRAPYRRANWEARL